MPVVTIKFNLPEEEEDYRVYGKAFRLSSAAFDMYNYLRNQEKHVDPENYPSLVEIRAQFDDLFYNLIFED